MTLITCKGPRDLFAITKVSFGPYLTWKISPSVVFFCLKLTMFSRAYLLLSSTTHLRCQYIEKIIDEITFQVGSLSHWKLLVLLGGLFGINFNIFSFPCLLLKTRYLQQQTSTEELPFEANSTDVLLQRFLLICPKPLKWCLVQPC